LGAVENAIAKLEREPGPWRVMAISYPGRIVGDLHGWGPLPPGSRQLEAMLLGKLGRNDLYGVK
jgi:hypothetical protein